MGSFKSPPGGKALVSMEHNGSAPRWEMKVLGVWERVCCAFERKRAPAGGKTHPDKSFLSFESDPWDRSSCENNYLQRRSLLRGPPFRGYLDSVQRRIVLRKRGQRGWRSFWGGRNVRHPRFTSAALIQKQVCGGRKSRDQQGGICGENSGDEEAGVPKPPKNTPPLRPGP